MCFLRKCERSEDLSGEGKGYEITKVRGPDASIVFVDSFIALALAGPLFQWQDAFEKGPSRIEMRGPLNYLFYHYGHIS